jgi:hypothetical protein
MTSPLLAPGPTTRADADVHSRVENSIPDAVRCRTFRLAVCRIESNSALHLRSLKGRDHAARVPDP